MRNNKKTSNAKDAGAKGGNCISSLGTPPEKKTRKAVTEKPLNPRSLSRPRTAFRKPASPDRAKPAPIAAPRQELRGACPPAQCPPPADAPASPCPPIDAIKAWAEAPKAFRVPVFRALDVAGAAVLCNGDRGLAEKIAFAKVVLERCADRPREAAGPHTHCEFWGINDGACHALPAEAYALASAPAREHWETAAVGHVVCRLAILIEQIAEASDRDRWGAFERAALDASREMRAAAKAAIAVRGAAPEGATRHADAIRLHLDAAALHASALKEFAHTEAEKQAAPPPSNAAELDRTGARR